MIDLESRPRFRRGRLFDSDATAIASRSFPLARE
jgi:hypothetical protein